MRKKQVSAREILKIYFEEAKNHPSQLAGSFVFLLSAVGFTTITPFFASRTLAAILQHGQNFWIELLWLGVVIAVSIITNRIGFACFIRVQARGMHNLHHRALRTVLARSQRFHSNTIGGKLVSDIYDFVQGFADMFSLAFSNGGATALNMLVGLILVTVFAWPLGVYLAIMLAIIIIWVYRESRKRTALRNARLIAGKELISQTSDAIVNATTVKTFAAEAREIHTADGLSRTLRDLRTKDWIRAGNSGSHRMTFLLVALLGLLIVAYFQDGKGFQTASITIFALSYTLSLVMRLFDLNTIIRNFEETLLKATPITKLLGEVFEIKDKPGAKALEFKSGNIDFNDVSFAYTDKRTKQQIFSKLNLHIKAGETVGLVGPSGGGKTTLTRLLLRFDDVQDGAITIDGQDIRSVTQTSLRDAVSYVPQEPLLFHRSIKDNIAYGKAQASNQAIQKAAEMSNAHDFVSKLPHGYRTLVGERGVKLSGGQRQRVAIARAMLKNAPILVLDEATSALDSESEALVQDAIFNLMRGKTTLVIAHRLSTIQRLDRIIVLDDGKIVEQGNHSDLIKKRNGTYARLWQRQTGNRLEE